MEEETVIAMPEKEILRGGGARDYKGKSGMSGPACP